MPFAPYNYGPGPLYGQTNPMLAAIMAARRKQVDKQSTGQQPFAPRPAAQKHAAPPQAPPLQAPPGGAPVDDTFVPYGARPEEATALRAQTQNALNLYNSLQQATQEMTSYNPAPVQPPQYQEPKGDPVSTGLELLAGLIFPKVLAYPMSATISQTRQDAIEAAKRTYESALQQAQLQQQSQQQNLERLTQRFSATDRAYQSALDERDKLSEAVMKRTQADAMIQYHIDHDKWYQKYLYKNLDQKWAIHKDDMVAKADQLQNQLKIAGMRTDTSLKVATLGAQSRAVLDVFNQYHNDQRAMLNAGVRLSGQQLQALRAQASVFGNEVQKWADLAKNGNPQQKTEAANQLESLLKSNQYQAFQSALSSSGLWSEDPTSAVQELYTDVSGQLGATPQVSGDAMSALATMMPMLLQAMQGKQGQGAATVNNNIIVPSGQGQLQTKQQGVQAKPPPNTVAGGGGDPHLMGVLQAISKAAPGGEEAEKQAALKAINAIPGLTREQRLALLQQVAGMMPSGGSEATARP